MSGKIFINYRHGDEPGFTQALLGRLEQAFPAERLFIDVDNIPPGEDFVRMLESQVAQCRFAAKELVASTARVATQFPPQTEEF
jgi:hypothetical protein